MPLLQLMMVLIVAGISNLISFEAQHGSYEATMLLVSDRVGQLMLTKAPGG